MVKWLTILAVALGLLWSGWWFLGSRAAEQGIRTGLDAARLQGWDIAYEDLSVVGYPSRFDTTLAAPSVTTPDGAIRWSAPFLQVFALAYRPNHVIAVAPPEMTVEVPGEAVDITNGDLRASVVVTPSTAPVLDRTAVTTESLRVALADLWVEVAAGQFATRQAGSEEAHDVALTLTDVVLSPAVRAALDPAAEMSERLDSVAVEATATLSEAIGAGRAPRMQALDLRRAEVIWGDVSADLTGDLTVDAAGVPSGTLTLRAKGWETVLRAVAGAGLIPTERLPLLSAGLAGMADADGTIATDLVIEAGQMRLGPIPLGPAPRL
ncbi:DUF2125 domain-containing protein [Jannaschia marina]|uniref:DUF2125 domain-containing protein n=1 Tax=Jannaschia marina TaxID=2741674 RepID=UPI0015C7D6AE|nr:DUF2125 domain-containing protein [Jannaschia marina]